MHKLPIIWNIAAWVWTARAFDSARARRGGREGKRRMSETAAFDEHDVPELTDTSAEFFVSKLEEEE